MKSRETNWDDVGEWVTWIIVILLAIGVVYYGTRVLDTRIYPQLWTIVPQ